MANHVDDSLRKTGDNLRRLMAERGLTTDQVAERSGVDKRTIQGVLDGRKKPHPRTVNRLAKGLGVSVDEFFVDPAQLLYRRFDRRTNPVVGEVIEANPQIFAGWTAADLDELHSRVGAGGPLTAEGALAAAREMNANRELYEKLALLLESSQAEVIAGIIELMHQKVSVEKP